MPSADRMVSELAAWMRIRPVDGQPLGTAMVLAHRSLKRVGRGGLAFLLAGIVSSGLRELLADGGGSARPRSPHIESLRVIVDEGARPRFSPSGESIVFDRKTSDGYYDLYLCDLDGRIAASLTDGAPGIGQRNNGNGVLDPTGRFAVFVSEAPEHFRDGVKYYGDPGLGLYCNLWAVDLVRGQFRQLTDVPIKRTLADGLPSFGVVNPHFSSDGRRLLWTERYAERDDMGYWAKRGKPVHWGKWRIRGADFAVEDGVPRLANTRTLFVPAKGNYVTYMGQLPSGEWILAGNLDGQHEYGMDQYRYDPKTGGLLNLQSTPQLWEEDASLLLGVRIIYMTNADSPRTYDFGNPSWASQPMERDYYWMDTDGSHKERLTSFNDPSAPEYMGKRVIVAASDVSPDGKYLAGTLGVDSGNGTARSISLKIVLMEFRRPLQGVPPTTGRGVP